MASSRSPITRRAAAALALSAPIGLAAAALADDDKAKRPGPTPGNPKDGPGAMEAWWVDLEKTETEATRALLNMSDRREETIAFLKAKMKPLKISAAEVRALILKLGNDNEKVWKPAFEERIKGSGTNLDRENKGVRERIKGSGTNLDSLRE
jgi:Spy/CpxP family protein refolding chaperone